MAESSFLRALLGLPKRIGQLAVAPDQALARADAEGGGMRDALTLVVAAVVAFRMPELVQRLLTIAEGTSGAALRLLALFADEARHAAWFVLPAAVVVTYLARDRRDAGRDLDLAAACYPAVFVVGGLERALAALTGARPGAGRVADGVAAVAVAVLVWRAVRVARARPPAKTAAAEPSAGLAPPPNSARKAAPVASGVVVALAAALTVHGAIWSARNIEVLRPIAHGQRAPEFSLARIDGAPGPVALTALRGQVVVLDFWATWCGPCIEMMPVLDTLHRAWGPRGVSFIGVNSDMGASDDDIRAFLAKHPVSYPVVRDTDGEVGARYRLEALPNIVVVGRDGRIRGSYLGLTRQATLEKALREAVESAQ